MQLQSNHFNIIMRLFLTDRSTFAFSTVPPKINAIFLPILALNPFYSPWKLPQSNICSWVTTQVWRGGFKSNWKLANSSNCSINWCVPTKKLFHKKTCIGGRSPPSKNTPVRLIGDSELSRGAGVHGRYGRCLYVGPVGDCRPVQVGHRLISDKPNGHDTHRNSPVHKQGNQ